MSAQCIGGMDAVEFFDSLKDRITDKERDTYEKAMNRIKYEAAKGIGVRKKTVKAVKSWHHDTHVCGRCGFGADAPENKYCPNCGTRYLDNDYTEKKLKTKKEENHQMDIEEWLKGVDVGG